MKKRVLWCLLALCLTVTALLVPAMAADEVMTVPANGEALRQAVVDYATQLSLVEWTTDEVIDFTHAVSWTGDTYYTAGTQYFGLPYTSDRISANANLDEFAAHIQDGKYVGSTTWNELPGSDCGGQVRLAYGYAGVLCELELEGLMFSPDELGRSFGLIPLGDYDCSGFTYSQPTTVSIMKPNGEQKMYDCYAQLNVGDSLFVVYAGSGEHIMLVTGPAEIKKDGAGNYLGDQCTVPVLELNAAVHDRGTYKTNWNSGSYRFVDLFNTGFIPYTAEAFSRETIDAPNFTYQGVDLSGDAGFHALMSGQVRCNYNIFTLSADVTDASGNLAASGIAYPNSLVADLAELSYGDQLLGLAAGDYHFTLKAKIGYGEQTIVETDFHYAGCEGAPVVYVDDNGTGNGSSAENAIGNTPGFDDMSMTSYKNSAFYRAVAMLQTTGGTIVVSGDTTMISGRGLPRYKNNVSTFSAPSVFSEQIITLTSNDGKTDYRKNGAQLIMQRSGDQGVDLELSIGTVWKDLDFVVDYNYAMMPPITISTIGAFVSCGRGKTVIEDSVTVTLTQAGKKIDQEKNKKYLPRLYGGYYNVCANGNADLTVLGGSWSTVVGGSDSSYLYGGANLTFGGSAYACDGLCGGTSNNQGAIGGDVTVNITGGTLAGKLILGSSGFNLMDGYAVTTTMSGKPDLSGVRIVNAGVDERASSVKLDLGGLKNGSQFTAYYNPAEFTEIIPAPAGGSFPVVPVCIGAGVVVIAAAAALVILKKKKKNSAQQEEA